MSDDPYLPRYKDQVASVPAERRPPPAHSNPDGTLLAEEPSHATSGRKPVARSAADDRAPPSPAEPTQIPIAFPVASVAADRSPTNSRIFQQRSWICVASIALVTLIAIAVIAGVVVFAVCGSGGCGEPAQVTAPPAGNGVTPAPTAAVVPTEGSIMTPSPSTSATTFTRTQNITNFINSKTYMGFNLSATGDSPEELALRWLIYTDPLRRNDSDLDEFRVLQRYSLLTLWYQSDTGKTWVDSTNWLKAEDECTWAGIGCQSGVVTQVDLRENGLRGSLSPDLGLLTDLADLVLDRNNLMGSTLPTSIGRWSSLNSIFVQVCALSGSLPSEIGLWTDLKVFAAYSNSLTGTIPETIANWEHIELASFRSNTLTGSVPEGICEFVTGGVQLRADCDLPCSCCNKTDCS